MDIRFNCPHCGQHLCVEERAAGMTVSCPSCNQQSEVPPATAVPPVLVAAKPKAMQQSQTKSRQQTSGLKTCGAFAFLAVMAVVAVVVALVLWFAYSSTKPKLLATVDVIRNETLRVTNANDTAWNSPTIILNDGFGGPILEVSGAWAPNETRELALDDFKGRLNHQRFNPQVEHVREVLIQARGFQLGMYQTRR
jgi:hypothetical protein